MTEHPITPPPELVQQWIEQGVSRPPSTDYMTWFATQAACWGADQELEACEKYWMTHGISPQGVVAMRYARRPKPPSLKEQALEALREAAYMADGAPPQGICSDQIDVIRRALEQLDD